MAAALTLTAGNAPLTNATVSGTGFTALTDYDVLILRPGGFTTTRTVTSDGAGAFSFTITPQGRGNYVVNAYLHTPVSAATVTTSILSDN